MNPKTTKLKQIMTSPVKVAKRDDNLLTWLRQMSNERFRHVPVVDSNGKLINIMSQGDFVSYTWPDLIFQATQLAKASFLKGFSVNTLLIMMLVYGVALIAAMKAIL